MANTILANQLGSCPNCGAQLYGDEIFCTQCGADLRQLGLQPTIPGNKQVGTCSVCNKPLREGDNYCIYCGTPVGNTPVGNTPVGNTPVGNTPVGGTPVGDTLGSGAPPYTPPIGGVYTTVPALRLDDDDHPTARPKSLRITREEARDGCKKTLEVEGNSITVELPAGIGWDTKLDVPGLGYFDQMTGERGPLRLSFRIV